MPHGHVINPENPDCLSVALTLVAANAQAALVTNVLGANTWDTDSANFTFLAATGGNIGEGANDVVMHWDGNAYNASSDYTGPGSTAKVNVTAGGSHMPFFGHNWTAHDVQMFVPGSYSFDVTLGGGNPETGTLSATVSPGQLGMHMLWDWNGNNNIDVFIVFSQNSIFGSGLLYSTQKNSLGQLTCDARFTGMMVPVTAAPAYRPRTKCGCSPQLMAMGTVLWVSRWRPTDRSPVSVLTSTPT